MLSPDEIERRCLAAGIAGRQAEWTLTSFEAAFPEHAGIMGWMMEWVRKPIVPAVYLYGPTGRGKSGLATAVARERIANGAGDPRPWSIYADPVVQAYYAKGEIRRKPTPVWVERWSELQRRVKRDVARQHGTDWEVSEADLIQELVEVEDLLVLDDIGVGGYTQWREGLLLAILDRVEVWERRTLLTGNLPVPALAKVAGDRVADRLADVKMFQTLELRVPYSGRVPVRKASGGGSSLSLR